MRLPSFGLSDGVHDDRRQVSLKIPLHLDVVQQCLVLDQGEAFPQHAVDITWLLERLSLPGKVQQASDNLRATLGLDDDLLNECSRRIAVRHLLQQQVGVGDNPLQWVVHLVGHIGGQVTDER